MATVHRSKYQVLADKFVRRWVHLAPYGIRKGHPSGELNLSREAVLKIIDEFQANPNPLQVDFEHASLEKHPSGQPIPAAGWIHALAAREDGLWGYIYWTAEAADLIRAGKYLYNSPVVVTNKPDGTTNKPIEIQLWNGALTNQPFLKGQQPLAMRDTMPEIEEQKKENTPPVPPAKSELELLFEQLQALSGLDAEALKKAIAAKTKAVANLLASDVVDGQDEPNKWANSEAAKPLLARIDELNNQVNTLSQKIAARDQADVEAFVDKKIKGGYVLDAQKADVIRACKDYGREYVERVWSCKQVPIEEEVAGKDPKKGNDPAKIDPELKPYFVASGIFSPKRLETLFKG